MKIIRLFALILCSPLAYAGLPCASSGPDSPPGVTWQKFQVSKKWMDSAGDLLGLRGERVTPAVPSKVLLDNGRAELTPYWANQVDWALYQHLSKTDVAEYALYFEGGRQGGRFLCRIDEKQISEKYREREAALYEKDLPPPPVGESDLAPQFIELFGYNEAGQWIRRETYSYDGEKKKWGRTGGQKYSYGGNGYLAARTEIDVDASSRPEAEYFVHDAGNKILRAINSAYVTEFVNGQYAQIKRSKITIYDSDGKDVAYYQQNPANRSYRRATGNVRTQDVYVFSGPEELNFRWVDGSGFLAMNRRWRVVSIPAEEAGHDELYTYQAGHPAVLADGFTGNKGRVEMKGSAVKVWQAILDPARLTYLVSIHDYLLVPAVPVARWRDCLDPKKNTRAACP